MCGSTSSRPSFKHKRPKSADLGGLQLAIGSEDQGHGWLGDGTDLQWVACIYAREYATDNHTRTPFAELLSDMYTESVGALNEPEDDL